VSPSEQPLIPPWIVVESPGTWMMVEWSGVVVVSRIMSGRKKKHLYKDTSLKVIGWCFISYHLVKKLSNNFKIKQPVLEMNPAGVVSIKDTVNLDYMATAGPPSFIVG
jgi:hypothetical protein